MEATLSHEIPNASWMTLDLNQTAAGKMLVGGVCRGRPLTARPARLGHARGRRGARPGGPGSPTCPAAATSDCALGYGNVAWNSTSAGGTCSE